MGAGPHRGRHQGALRRLYCFGMASILLRRGGRFGCEACKGHLYKYRADAAAIRPCWLARSWRVCGLDCALLFQPEKALVYRGGLFLLCSLSLSLTLHLREVRYYSLIILFAGCALWTYFSYHLFQTIRFRIYLFSPAVPFRSPHGLLSGVYHFMHHHGPAYPGKAHAWTPSYCLAPIIIGFGKGSGALHCLRAGGAEIFSILRNFPHRRGHPSLLPGQGGSVIRSICLSLYLFSGNMNFCRPPSV